MVKSHPQLRLQMVGIEVDPSLETISAVFRLSRINTGNLVLVGFVGLVGGVRSTGRAQSYPCGIRCRYPNEPRAISPRTRWWVLKSYPYTILTPDSSRILLIHLLIHLYNILTKRDCHSENFLLTTSFSVFWITSWNWHFREPHQLVINLVQGFLPVETSFSLHKDFIR